MVEPQDQFLLELNLIQKPVEHFDKTHQIGSNFNFRL